MRVSCPSIIYCTPEEIYVTKKEPTCLGKSIANAGISYSLLLFVWFILRGLFFDQIWQLAIINTLIVYLFLPLPLLILGAALARQKRALIALGAPLGIFLYFWGAQFLPRLPFPPPVDPHKELRLMTYNVLFNHSKPNQFANNIKQVSADIVGLQEMRTALIKSAGPELLDSYPYNTFDLPGPSGVALISRYPILSASRFSLPPKDEAVYAVIDWNGTRLHVIAAHFRATNAWGLPYADLAIQAPERYQERANQVGLILQKINQIEGPLVFLCDCNMTDTSEAYYRIHQVLADGYREAGWGFGNTLHPPHAPFPLQRIDYIWHSSQFRALSAVTGQPAGSDHHPVIATFEYVGE